MLPIIEVTLSFVILILVITELYIFITGTEGKDPVVLKKSLKQSTILHVAIIVVCIVSGIIDTVLRDYFGLACVSIIAGLSAYGVFRNNKRMENLEESRQSNL